MSSICRPYSSIFVTSSPFLRLFSFLSISSICVSILSTFASVSSWPFIPLRLLIFILLMTIFRTDSSSTFLSHQLFIKDFSSPLFTALSLSPFRCLCFSSPIFCLYYFVANIYCIFVASLLYCSVWVASSTSQFICRNYSIDIFVAASLSSYFHCRFIVAYHGLHFIVFVFSLLFLGHGLFVAISPWPMLRRCFYVSVLFSPVCRCCFFTGAYLSLTLLDQILSPFLYKQFSIALFLRHFSLQFFVTVFPPWFHHLCSLSSFLHHWFPTPNLYLFFVSIGPRPFLIGCFFVTFTCCNFFAPISLLRFLCHLSFHPACSTLFI